MVIYFEYVWLDKKSQIRSRTRVLDFKDFSKKCVNLKTIPKWRIQDNTENIQIINEAIREVGLDINEGADFVMVKPGMPYLDIIKEIKSKFKIPVFSYQVSGEYSMIKNGIKSGFLNEEAIIESLMSLKRT